MESPLRRHNFPTWRHCHYFSIVADISLWQKFGGHNFYRRNPYFIRIWPEKCSFLKVCLELGTSYDHQVSQSCVDNSTNQTNKHSRKTKFSLWKWLEQRSRWYWALNISPNSAHKSTVLNIFKKILQWKLILLAL